MIAADHDEEEVLGISIADPEVLKATQFVLVSVGITAFFLALELVHVIETQGAKELHGLEAVLWVLDMLRAAVMVGSGYAGVKRSDRSLLGLFYFLCCISFVWSVGSAVVDLAESATPELIVLQSFEALFFLIGSVYSRFLWREAEKRSLQAGSVEGEDSKGYSLLGIPMMDLKVLKATQLVFTALGIIFCVLGSAVVVGAKNAIANRGSSREFWFFCIGLLTSMTGSGYYGVKRSSTVLLSIFFGISVSLFMLFALGTFMTLLSCSEECLTMLFMLTGIDGVLLVAAKGSWYLRDKAAQGTVLTAPRKHRTSAVPATSVGTAMQLEDLEMVAGAGPLPHAPQAGITLQDLGLSVDGASQRTAEQPS
eukprot:TRINITY_DN51551_c0_g1_i2.p1 TRINITY_DN51551_c0_g1~~TRINITY_DN51551_c0_g1_i2.p1  ORF type:complete len:367 (-),score=82.21 TRINITY_DN51551_c0_g1_i2:498-1598(-)